MENTTKEYQEGHPYGYMLDNSYQPISNEKQIQDQVQFEGGSSDDNLSKSDSNEDSNDSDQNIAKNVREHLNAMANVANHEV